MIHGDPTDFEVKRERGVGFIAYKIFGSLYEVPFTWRIEELSWITDAVDTDITEGCSYGINVASNPKWFPSYLAGNYGELRNFSFDVWEVFIPDEAEVVFPEDDLYKFRTNRCQLLRVVDRIHAHKYYNGYVT